MAWTLTMIGLAPIFLLTSKPIGMPIATSIERFAAMLSYSSPSDAASSSDFWQLDAQVLYDRSFELKEAYKRIEELAELDELTGSFNRRSIMRMLDDEIARADRNGRPARSR